MVVQILNCPKFFASEFYIVRKFYLLVNFPTEELINCILKKEVLGVLLSAYRCSPLINFQNLFTQDALFRHPPITFFSKISPKATFRGDALAEPCFCLPDGALHCELGNVTVIFFGDKKPLHFLLHFW